MQTEQTRRGERQECRDPTRYNNTTCTPGASAGAVNQAQRQASAQPWFQSAHTTATFLELQTMQTTNLSTILPAWSA